MKSPANQWALWWSDVTLKKINK